MINAWLIELTANRLISACDMIVGCLLGLPALIVAPDHTNKAICE